MADELFGSQSRDITKERPNLSAIIAGMGWKMTEKTPKDLYFDMVAYALEEDGKCHRKEDIIYFYNKVVKNRRDEIFKHMNVDEIVTDKTLKKDDFEQILVSLYDVPHRIKEVVFCAGIYNSKENGYNLKQIQELYFHVFNIENFEEILISTYTNFFTIESCIVFGRLIRKDDGNWYYKGINQGYMGDIGTLHAIYYRGDDEELTQEEIEADKEVVDENANSLSDILNGD